ncbi:MAG: DegT/DnrJ/EryC1/StrS family aminotransferase, partial [Thermoguttaceae bacterium]|nr:DegT/DnrJ/EryC1/StrS family aminotransferase [Thermoguttaceae bacterium]
RHYSELFSESRPCADIVLPTALDGLYHVWNQYVVRIPGGLRDTLRAELTEKKIGTEVYYPLGLHQQECFRYLGYAPQSLPETYRASQEVLALPMFPELTAEERVRVVGAIEAFFLSGHGRQLFPAAKAPGAVRSAA